MAETSVIPALCRDCAAKADGLSRCRDCGSPRLVRHPELNQLALAHIDCDAFFATVEKRDNPDLKNKPVIVGGGKRGVVAACCYLARMKGVHSAMPMYQARKLCPNAVEIAPDKDKYSRVGQEVRTLMCEATPLVEPLSVDEAFLDLRGTERLHKGSAAHTLIDLVLRIEREIGITASVGLSYNKFLAKVASDLDKPRGFAIIGQAEALEFLENRSVKTIWGVGAALAAKLDRDGIKTICQLRTLSEQALLKRYGSIGSRLYHFARGIDTRKVDPTSETKSISAETTFDQNIRDLDILKKQLWPLCEKVSARLKSHHLAARNVTLKIKTSQFKSYSRTRRLDVSTQLAETLFSEGIALLKNEIDGRAFRLIGIGADNLEDEGGADTASLLDPERTHNAKLEGVMDAIREKFGTPSIGKGRGLKK